MKNFLLTTLLLAFCVGRSSAQIDSTIGIKAPKDVARDHARLAHYLTDNVQGDALKVNAIYNWLTHNIRYDVKAFQKGNLKRPTIKQVLKKRKSLCDGYSDLFAEMCKDVGINAMTVSGYARDWIFDDSDKFYKPRHAWNAVSIGNRWYLVDATWGAGGIGQYPSWFQKLIRKASKNPVGSGKLKFRFNYDPAWLMTAPGEFRLTHAPYDPVWQLTDSLMPLYIFEAGEESITAFNETYGRPMMSPKELNRLSLLPEHIQVIEQTERAYQYNPRFHVSKAMQHHANAIDSIAALKKNAAPVYRNAVMTQVKQELKSSEKYVSLQKESIAVEYRALKSKNKSKNLAAKQYIRSVTSNNKQAITRCKSKVTSAEKKQKNLMKKGGAAVAANKKVQPQKFNATQTASPEDKPSSPQLRVLEDSIKTRTAKMPSMQAKLKADEELVDRMIAANRLRLDTLASYLTLADSALIQETIGRINLKDNYDAPIKKWSSIYKEARMQNADTLQRNYFATYDSILVHFEELRKDQLNYLQQYQKNFKDLAQYKRRNSSNIELLAQYSTQMGNYTQAYQDQLQRIGKQSVYITDNQALLKSLVKLYKQQEKLANYMDKSEKHRQKLEQNYLTKKEAFDKKENKLQKKQVSEALKEAEKYLNSGRVVKI